MWIEEHFKTLAMDSGLSYLWKDYENTKERVHRLFDSAQRRYTFLNLVKREEGSDHFKEIIERMSLVTEPLEEKLKWNVQGEEEAELRKGAIKELYVLLSAVYLHDIAKTYPELIIKELIGESQQVLDIDEIRRIEEVHADNAFKLLMLLINPCYADDKNIGEMDYFLKRLHEDRPNQKDEHGLFHEITGNERSLLIAAIAYVCGLHKCLSFKEEKEKKPDFDSFLKTHFEHSQNQSTDGWNVEWQGARLRVDLLAALLKLGDCFDITNKRIKKTEFDEELAKIKARKDKKIPEIMYKWLQFYFTKEVIVKSAAQGSDDIVDIIVRYEIPKNLDRIQFLRFRKDAEKDFIDQSIFKVIEYYCEEKDQFNRDRFGQFIRQKYGKGKKGSVYINFKYRLTIGHEEDSLPVSKINGLPNGMVPKSTLEPLSRFPIDFPLSRSENEGLAFYLPNSEHVLFIIALFERYSQVSLTLEQISEKTGIAADRVAVCCAELEKECYIRREVTRLSPGGYVKSPAKSEKERKAQKKIDKIMKSYQENSYNMKTKAEEMEVLGEPLPLENVTKGGTITTGVSGLDDILGKGIAGDKTILIKGPPGTGKTTFGIQWLVKNRNVDNLDINTLYVPFGEDLQQLKGDFLHFDLNSHKQWDLDTININPIRFDRRIHNKKTILSELTSILDAGKIDLLVVDSINYLAEYVSQAEVRELLYDFISVLKIRHITSFFIGEETEGYSFEEYLVDGIMRLTSDGDKRYLEIAKMRGQDLVEGKHSYRICDADAVKKENEGHPEPGPYHCGINVFPNISYYTKSIEKPKNQKNERKDEPPEIIKTGTEGLDDMLPSSRKKGKKEEPKDEKRKEQPSNNTMRVDDAPLTREEEEKKGEPTGGFIKGSAILLAGTPGSGKTIMGLQFLKKGKEEKEEEQTEQKQCAALWVSFEASDRVDLKKSIDTFNDSLKFKDLIADYNYFYFKHFSPARLNFDELVHVIRHHIETHKIDRLCIDSISDILAQFEGHPVQFKNNINSLCHYLTAKEVTTLFLYRMSQFFGESERIGVEIISMVDTILAIKNIEVHNKIERGITVLKVRGREHRGDIRSVMIDTDNGLRVRDIGWWLENLISGRTHEISEPFIFVKFFYENEAEDEIVEKAIEDFKSRYPEKSQFITRVRKPQIHIDYWSFSERRGPGHSNVKVFSISKHWAEAFHENKRLQNLKEYIPERIHQELEVIDDSFWKECRKGPSEKERGEESKHRRYDYFFIPDYADIGVLTYRKDILTDLLSEKNPEDPFLSFDETKELFNKLPEDVKKTNNLKYAFAMPALSEVSSFVAFFMEVVWAYEGDLFSFKDQIYDSEKKQLKDWRDARPEDLKSEVDDKFTELIKALKGSRVYASFLDEMKKRKSEAKGKHPNEYTELKKYLSQKQENIEITNINKAIESIDNLIVIDNKKAKEALAHLGTWCNEGICGNPYMGDFSKASLFSRQWYSRISTVYKELLLPEAKIAEMEREEDFKQKRKDRIREEILRKRKEKIGITFLPVIEKNKKCYIGYDLVCVGVIKGSVSPETGWLMIDALMTPENIFMRTKYRWGLPAKEEYYDRDQFKKQDEVAFEMAKKIRLESDPKRKTKIEERYFSKIPYFAEIEGIIHKHLKKFFSVIAQKSESDEGPDPQGTLTEIADEIKDLVREKNAGSAL